MFADIALAIVFMALLGLLLALALIIANKRLYVYQDPRIDAVEEMLPHANCGACGFPGCRAFAEKLVHGAAQPGQCTVNAKTMNQAIADFLGVDVGNQVKQVARLACAGGTNVARTHASYSGFDSCHGAALVSGGGKGCTWGCLGLADCADVCSFDAITMNTYNLPVVDTDQCTACGDCVDICPRDLFSLHPVDHKLWIACKSLEKDDAAEADCAVLCTGCGRCALDAPQGLITIKNNLAVIDYSKNNLASPLAIERCPTGAIVWIRDESEIVKGKEAKKIIRKSPLPVD